jgi:hypothetical protein
MSGMMLAFVGTGTQSGTPYNVTVYYATYTGGRADRTFYNSGYLSAGYGSIDNSSFYSSSQATTFTISSLYINGSGDGTSGGGTITLYMNGLVTPNQSAFTYLAVGGVNYFSANATYSGASNNASWTWTAATNPFGTTNGATVPVTIA